MLRHNANFGIYATNVIFIVTYYTLPPLESSTSSWMTRSQRSRRRDKGRWRLCNPLSARNGVARIFVWGGGHPVHFPSSLRGADRIQWGGGVAEIFRDLVYPIRFSGGGG